MLKYLSKNYWFPSFEFLWKSFWDGKDISCRNFLIVYVNMRNGDFSISLNYFDKISVDNCINGNSPFASEIIVKVINLKGIPPIFSSCSKERYPKRVRKIIQQFEEKYQKMLDAAPKLK